LASDIVVRTLATLDERPAGPDPAGALRAAAGSASQKIYDMCTENIAHDGMGTTATAVLLAGDQMALLNVGDSRAYLQRGGHLTQLTKDDTFVQTLVDQGLLT